ncbi:hypothetical protein STEG23_020562, partial [Scotinomys teguina]
DINAKLTAVEISLNIKMSEHVKNIFFFRNLDCAPKPVVAGEQPKEAKMPTSGI